ncbi:MAG: monovalent cation:proton antiporter-2 (CPA2) family protein [Ectothiorhodospiraceae bacterium]
MHALQDVLILLTASVLVVALLRRLTLPPILGYLAVGVALSPSATGLIDDSSEVRLLGEFGVVFLLFTIGLEFSFPQLRAMRWTVLGLGGAQVLVTSAACGVAAWALGVSWEGAVVLGGALALSSTAIVTKQLTEQLEIHTRHGRQSVGVLLFQDLAVVPLLILIPILAGDADRGPGLAPTMALAMAKGIGVFLLMVWLGRTALRPLFHEVAAARSNELFTLAVLLVALAAAWATHLAGLSLALGAFLAGIMLGETEYRHQIEADIRPFRDVLLGLFFITVGMLLDVRVLAANLHWVVLAVAALMLFKATLIYGLVRLSGADRRVAVRTGVILCQGGEFGFAVLSLALGASLIDPLASQIVLAAIVVSMALAPLLVRHNEIVAHHLAKADGAPRGSAAEREVADMAHSLKAHVIICGYGRTGQNVARFLEREGFSYLALDLDPARVREAQAAGDRVTFGDAARREIMMAAALEQARMVVISFDDPTAALTVLEHTREVRPDIPVLVRTRDDVWLARFQDAGATAIVPEILEASLMLASHALALLEVPMSKVFRYVRDVRADRYRLLKGYFHGEERVDLEKADRFREQLHAVTLPERANAVGKRIAATGLDEIDVEVTAVRRGGIRGPQPDPETLLVAGDVLVLYGTPENLEKAEALLLGGTD